MERLTTHFRESGQEITGMHSQSTSKIGLVRKTSCCRSREPLCQSVSFKRQVPFEGTNPI